jgi:DNA-binding Lrp family transcriptional regulator
MILDETDRALLRLLQQDADQSAAALAKNLDMSQPAIWRRIKRLKEEGVIKGVALNLNREKLGLGVTVFLGIKLATKGRVSLEDFERVLRRRIMTLPGVGDLEANVLLSEEKRPGPI